MAVEQQKYRANLFQFTGFALMTPLSKLLLDLFFVDIIKFNIKFLLLLLIAGFLFYFGLVFIVRGDKALEGE